MIVQSGIQLPFQTMPPFWRASAEYFRWRLNQKPMPVKPIRITPKLKGSLIGTKTVSKVHSTNLPMGVMRSWRFMASCCWRENKHLSACSGY